MEPNSESKSGLRVVVSQIVNEVFPQLCGFQPSFSPRRSVFKCFSVFAEDFKRDFSGGDDGERQIGLNQGEVDSTKCGRRRRRRSGSRGCITLGCAFPVGRIAGFTKRIVGSGLGSCPAERGCFELEEGIRRPLYTSGDECFLDNKSSSRSMPVVE